MKERLQLWFNILREKWRNFTKRQKITIIGIAVGLLIALILTLFLALRQNWTHITTAPNAAVGLEMQSILHDAGINSNLNAAGVLTVSENNADQAILLLSAANQLIGEEFNFSDFLEQSGMGVTAVAQHNMLIQVLETWLARTLAQFDGVNRAEVGLVVPQTSVFLISDSRASASVLVDTSRTLNSEDGRVIANFVARSVEGLLAENVTVMDTNLNELWPSDSLLEGSGIAAFTTQAEHVRQREARSAATTRMLLSTLVDVAEVAVHMAFNFDLVTTVEEIFTSPDGTDQGLPSHLITSMLEAAMEDGGGGIGVPGVDGAGIPGGMILDAFGGGTGTITDETFDATFLQNRAFIQTESEVGVFMPEQSSVAVTATRFVTYNQADLIELGVIDDTNAAWLQFQNDNQPQFMQEDERTLLATEAVIAATGIPNVVFIMELVPVFESMPEAPPMDWTQIILFAFAIILVSLLAFQLIRRTKPEVSAVDIEPELSVEDLLVSSQLDEEKEEMERLAEIQFAQDSQVKEQIDKFAGEKPESVAQLLRNWINEDWD